MSSIIETYNLALGHLGMQGITSVTEETPSAIALNNYYAPCRDDALGDAKWVFATHKEKLVSVSDTVLELEWGYVYVYPTAALRVWNVYNSSTVDNKHEQEFESVYQQSNNRRVLCSDLDSAYAEYTYKLEDTTLYPAKFILALSYKLAASAAHTLIGDADKGLKLLDVYNGVLGEAKRLGYIERIKKPKKITSSYQNARG